MIKAATKEHFNRMNEKQLLISWEHLFLYGVCYIDETEGVIKNVETKDVRIREIDNKLMLITELKESKYENNKNITEGKRF